MRDYTKLEGLSMGNTIVSNSKCFGIYAGRSKDKQNPTETEHLCPRFPLSQLRKSTKNFHRHAVIGEAPYGKVYKGCIFINGQQKEIAVKRGIAKYDQGFKELKNEVLMLSQLQHTNLVPLVGMYYKDEKEMVLVYDYMPNGSLERHLLGNQTTPSLNSSVLFLSWKKRLEISIGVARALHYIHTGTKRTIIHRDVKMSNILLDKNHVPKLSNFLFSLKGAKYSSKAPKKIVVDSITGTHGYLAPEYVKHGSVTEKIDVYSFGVLLVELVCGKKIMYIDEIVQEIKEDDEGEHSGSSSIWINVGKKVHSSVEKGKSEKIMDPNLVGKIGGECWKLYIEIAERCLNEDPNERPAMGEVEVELEHALELQEQTDANL